MQADCFHRVGKAVVWYKYTVFNNNKFDISLTACWCEFQGVIQQTDRGKPMLLKEIIMRFINLNIEYSVTVIVDD